MSGIRVVRIVAMGALAMSFAVAQQIRIASESIPHEAIEAPSGELPTVFARRAMQLDGEVEGPAWIGSRDGISRGSNGRALGNVLRAAAAAKPGESPRGKGADWSNNSLEKSLAREVGLPRVPRRVQRESGKDVVLSGDSADPDWSGVRGIHLKGRKTETVLPPGQYGSLALENGTLVLGSVDGKGATEYYFKDLRLSSSAALRLVGPAKITLDGDSILGGSVGNQANPDWLDIRLSAGSLVVERGSRVYGFLLASAGAVHIKGGSELHGSLAADGISIDPGARVVRAAPKPVPSARQPFLPKAMRVESRIPAIAERMGHDYSVSISYSDDIPHLMLNEGVRSGFAKLDVRKDRLALLAALTDTLVNTGFERAVVTMVRHREGGPQPDDVTNFPFSRRDLDKALEFAGRKNNPIDNIRRITSDDLCLNVFWQYCQELAAVKQQVQGRAGR